MRKMANHQKEQTHSRSVFKPKTQVGLLSKELSPSQVEAVRNAVVNSEALGRFYPQLLEQ